ncbi:hypothetical protein HF086_005072 [Spodoptera exigua]|uniref:Phosphotriesterase-related protein n=1 Tax=Spodoptera exigua TaxID=7107 RepID=A0A922MHB7_SPOEX|nr:hypothetical protein HF086_005072 [Spodoptera exigua]
MSSKVQTGDVSPAVLGRTLTHEHLAMNFEHFYREPPSTLAGKFQVPSLELHRLGYVRQYPYSLRYNLQLDDDAAQSAVTDDVIEYKIAGGGTIVENTTEGLNRDIKFYQHVSRASNVHIVAGTGHYIADLQNGDTLQKSTEDVYNHMLQELTKGCVNYEQVKAGFMGEIASVWPLRGTLVEDDILLEFSQLGTYCQFDLFGTEVSYYQLEVTTDMLSDAQRIQKMAALVKEGRGNRILMSHDIHTKHRLVSKGSII